MNTTWTSDYLTFNHDSLILTTVLVNDINVRKGSTGIVN